MWGIVDLGGSVAFYQNGALVCIVPKSNIAQAALNGTRSSNPSLNRNSLTFTFNGNRQPITISYEEINYFWYSGVINPFVGYGNLNEFLQAVKSLFQPQQCYTCFVLAPIIVTVAFDPLNFPIVPVTPGEWTPTAPANCTLQVSDCNEPAPEILITGSTPALPADTEVYFFPVIPNGAGTYGAIVFNKNGGTPYSGTYTLNVDVWINGIFQSTTIDFNFV